MAAKKKLHPLEQNQKKIVYVQANISRYVDQMEPPTPTLAWPNVAVSLLLAVFALGHLPKIASAPCNTILFVDPMDKLIPTHARPPALE